MHWKNVYIQCQGHIGGTIFYVNFGLVKAIALARIEKQFLYVVKNSTHNVLVLYVYRKHEVFFLYTK